MPDGAGTSYARELLAGQVDPKRLAARLQRAKTVRAYFEPLLDEAIRLYLPARRGFYNRSQGIDNAAEIYDETGSNALQEFASRLHAGMTPNFTKFALLEAGPDVAPQDRASINADLESINDYLFEEIWQSNFSQEAHESYLDSALSVGALLVEEGQHDNLIHNMAVPLTELYLESGPRDEIGGMFRERDVQAHMLEHTYPKATFSKTLRDIIANEKDKPICVVDAIWADYSTPGESAIACTFLPNHDSEVIQHRRMTGLGCNPFIGFRFGKIAGEVWGRGPALNTLPAVRTMNMTLEMILQNAALQMAGMYHLDDDSIINAETVTIEPGAILPRAPGTRGLEAIDMSGRGGFTLEQILLDNQAIKIRRGLFNDMLSDPNKTPATALEVAERMADLSDRMAAHFGRLHYEFTSPFLRRVLYLATKKGRVELPTLKGKRVGVRAISPLALAQGQRDIQNLVQYHQITTAFFGPQMASAQYDPTQLLPYLRDRLSAPEGVFADANKVAQKVAAMMGVQAAGMDAGGGPAGAVQLQGR